MILKGALTDLKAHLHWNQHTEVPGRSPGRGLKRPGKSLGSIMMDIGRLSKIFKKAGSQRKAKIVQFFTVILYKNIYYKTQAEY